MALFAVFVGLLSLYSVSGCRVPPSFWCSSLEIARECKVADQCWENQWSKLQAGEAQPVDFALYYESLCPDCQLFITKKLYPTYEQISQIVNLTLVPYGNAQEEREGNKWKFQCQHGPEECVGNIIETCAIHILKDIKVYFPFIYCMEKSSASASVTNAFELCAKQQNVSAAGDILACSKSDLGNQLEHQMAAKTDALQPPHQYVPWVTLNGVHTEDIQKKAEKDLKGLLCDAYKGVKPPACSEGEKKVCQREF